MTVAATLRSLSGQFGLNATELATFLRNPEEPYPSPGLVRTMMGEYAEPTERFRWLLSYRTAELDCAIEPNTIATFNLSGKIRRIVAVDSEGHSRVLVRIAEGVDIPAGDTQTLLALLGAIPGVELARMKCCAICEQLFVASSRRQEVCHRQGPNGRYPCVTERDRRKRAHNQLPTLKRPTGT